MSKCKHDWKILNVGPDWCRICGTLRRTKYKWDDASKRFRNLSSYTVPENLKERGRDE